MLTDQFRHIKSRLRLPWEVIKCRLMRTYKPLVIVWLITDRCNLRCRYCVHDWSGRRIQDYTSEEIIRIIDECKQLGTCHFNIHGGEILLRNDVGEIVNYIKDNGFYLNLISNGILLPEKIDQILRVDSLCISLDGREATCDFNRGRGSYQAAMQAIRLAKQKKLKLLVHAVLTKRSVEDIEYLCRQAKEIGYFQQFSLLVKPLNSSQQQEFGLTDQAAREALRKIYKLKRQGYPVFTSYRNLSNAINWPFSFKQSRLNKNEIPKKTNLIRCFYGKLKIAIDADGFAYPCTCTNDTFVALNVKEVGVKRAYEHILATNTCEACAFLTQNDWNLFLGGSLRQYFHQLNIQLRAVLNIF